MTGGPARAAVLLLALGCAAPPEGEPAPPVPPSGGESGTPGPLREGEWDREFPAGWTPVETETGPLSAVLGRVEDGDTGLPVAGARIRCHREYGTPVPGLWRPLLETSSDVDGRFSVPAEHSDRWFYVEADGYAPVAELGLPDAFSLSRGEDVEVEVRDWRERPLPGAVVELVLGCGHTPDIRSEVADARGRLTLRCVDPAGNGMTWVRADGAAGRNDGYFDGIDALPLVEGVRILRCEPAPVVEGRVADTLDRPIAGLFVGTGEAKRGPWTRTGTDGRFRLQRVPAWSEVSVADWGEEMNGWDRELAAFLAVPGTPVVVRLPPVDGNGPPPPAETRRAVPVLLRGEPAFDAGEPVAVRAVRDGDGAARSAITRAGDGGDDAADLPFALELGPGRWRVMAGDRAGSRRPAAAHVEVRPSGPVAAVRLTLERSPVVVPRVVARSDGAGGLVPGAEDADGNWWVVTDDGEQEAVPAQGGPAGGVHVPASGPFALRNRGVAWGAYRALDGLPPAGDGVVDVEANPAAWWPPRGAAEPVEDAEAGAAAPSESSGGVVEVRALDARGRPHRDFSATVAGEWPVSAHEGVVRVEGLPAGPVRLVVGGEGRRWHDVRLLLEENDRRHVTVTLRWTATERWESLGVFAYPWNVERDRDGRPLRLIFRVLDADGIPVAGARVTGTSSGADSRPDGEEEDLAVSDRDGWVRVPQDPARPIPGDHVGIASADHLPARVPVEGLAGRTIRLVRPGPVLRDDADPPAREAGAAGGALPVPVPGTAASLHVEIVDGDTGYALPGGSVLLDGEPFGGSGGRVTVPGVPPGRHELIVLAPGRVARRAHLTMAEEGDRNLRVELALDAR